MPDLLKEIPIVGIPLRAYNIMGLQNIRSFFVEDQQVIKSEQVNSEHIPQLKDVIDDIYSTHKKVIFTMGKGGVGKTTVAAAVALGLAKKGVKVHLTTTDPAAHLNNVISEQANISMSHIDEHEVLCTQEIAVFRAFADIVERAKKEVVVIDTAPTGHTLLLLDSTQSYHKEVQRTMGDTPESVKNLLPKLRNSDETEVIIVTFAETTPVFEAMRLEEDLHRAGINSKWWVINSSMYATATTNQLLKAKSSSEIEWINKVAAHADGNFAVIKWSSEEIAGEKLSEL